MYIDVFLYLRETDVRMLEHLKMSLVQKLEQELSLAKELVRNLKDEIDSIRAECLHEHTHKERDYDCHSARWLHICDDCGLISTQAYRAQHAAN